LPDMSWVRTFFAHMIVFLVIAFVAAKLRRRLYRLALPLSPYLRNTAPVWTRDVSDEESSGVGLGLGLVSPAVEASSSSQVPRSPRPFADAKQRPVGMGGGYVDAASEPQNSNSSTASSSSTTQRPHREDSHSRTGARVPPEYGLPSGTVLDDAVLNQIAQRVAAISRVERVGSDDAPPSYEAAGRS